MIGSIAPHEPDARREEAERYADGRAKQNGDRHILGGVEEIGEQTWIFDAIIGKRRRRPEIGGGPLQYGERSRQNDRRNDCCRRLPQRDEQNRSSETQRIERRERPHRGARPG
jgi:hypothetical protein